MRRSPAALAVVALVVFGAASADSARPLPPAHFPLSFTGLISLHRDTEVSGGHEATDWTVQITLRRTVKNDSFAHYSGTGKAQALIVGTCCGGCSYTAGPHQFEAEGRMEIRRSSRSGTGFEYQLDGGSAIVQLPWKIQCPVSAGNDPPSIPFSVGWGSSPKPYPGPTLEGQYEGRTDLARGVVRWKLIGKPDPNELMANPGGPYKVTRAQRVSLNGSGSTGKIVSYRWHLGPGGNCHGAALKNASKTGVTPNLVPLCSLHVTLTVADAQGETDSASTSITVVPREAGFRIPPVKHTEAPTDRRVDDPPFVHPGSTYGITLGANVSACGPGTGIAPTPWLCPPWRTTAGQKTGLGTRYTLAQVHDAGGPFDGFFYVGSAPLTIQRIGLLNYYFLPSGPTFVGNQPNIWNYNSAHQVSVGGALRNVDLNGLLAAMHAHEGMGLPGRPDTGHSGRLQSAVNDKSSDPRQLIEDKFATAQTAVQRQVDDELSSIERALFVATRDPLPVIWQGQMWLYDREDSVWRQEEVTVGG